MAGGWGPRGAGARTLGTGMAEIKGGGGRSQEAGVGHISPIRPIRPIGPMGVGSFRLALLSCKPERNLLVVGLNKHTGFHIVASPRLTWPAPPEREAKIASGNAQLYALV